VNGMDGINQSMEADDAHQWGGKVIGRDGVNQSMEAVHNLFKAVHMTVGSPGEIQVSLTYPGYPFLFLCNLLPRAPCLFSFKKVRSNARKSKPIRQSIIE
jgi:hypothetical protein